MPRLIMAVASSDFASITSFGVVPAAELPVAYHLSRPYLVAA